MTTAYRAEYQHNFAGFHNLPHLDGLLQFFCEQQYFIRTSTTLGFLNSENARRCRLRGRPTRGRPHASEASTDSSPTSVGQLGPEDNSLQVKDSRGWPSRPSATVRGQGCFEESMQRSDLERWCA